MMWTSNLRAICVVLLSWVLISGAVSNVHAQVTGGSVSGTVTDSGARVVNNVQIKITNVATGVAREVTTNDEGVYSAPNLQPGMYEVRFSAQGFKAETRSGIQLTVGAAAVLDVTLTL